MKRQVGEAVLAVEARRPEVDPEPAGNLAVDRSRAAVRAGSAGLFFGRQPLHFHVRIDDLVERARHLRPDPVEAILNERHDLGAALVAFRELVVRILRQRLHPFADRALASSRSPSGSRPSARAGAAARCGPSRGPRPASWSVVVDAFERPAVVLLAVRPRPHAGVVGGHGSLRLQLGDLPLERRRDLLRRDRPARSAQLPGMLFVRRSMDSTSDPPSRAFFADRRHLRQRLVDQERRRHQPAPRAACMRPSSPSSCFA